MGMEGVLFLGWWRVVPVEEQTGLSTLLFTPNWAILESVKSALNFYFRKNFGKTIMQYRFIMHTECIRIISWRWH